LVRLSSAKSFFGEQILRTKQLISSIKFVRFVKSFSDEGKSDFKSPHAHKYAVIIFVFTNFLDGMLILKCLFCERYKTPLQNDMRIHLRYTHQVRLLKDLPLSGKGFNMEHRAAYAIDIMRQIVPREYYDHRTARFASKGEDSVLDFFSYKYFME
jgi:hypothetical protein